MYMVLFRYFGTLSGSVVIKLRTFIPKFMLTRIFVGCICNRYDVIGLARDKEDDEYYIAQAGKVPVRWTSPEAIKDRKFSEKSDVWAYAITCTEIWNDGATPYTNWNNGMVMEKVLNGFKLACSTAPKPFYKVRMVPGVNPTTAKR